VTTVPLALRVLDLVVPDTLRGRPPGSDEVNEAQEADLRARLKEELGLTKEEFENRAFSFRFLPSVERTYHVQLPARFAPEKVPPSREITMGPSRFSESYTQVSPTVLEATFRFSADKAHFTAIDVAAFREAYWKRFSDSNTELRATFAPLKLFEEKNSKRGVELLKTWFKENPADAMTRARYARLLLRLGLGAQAKDEIERAFQDDAKSPLVLMIRGDIARHNADGLVYQAPFERKKSIESLRGALRLLPDYDWAATALAETLRRNEMGEIESEETADIKEARGLLEGFLARNESTTRSNQLLLEILVTTRNESELKRLLQKYPAFKKGEGPLSVLSDGIASTLTKVARITDEQARLGSLIANYTALATFGHYAEGEELLKGYSPTEGQTSDVNTLRELATGVSKLPKDTLDFSNPQNGSLSLMTLFANAKSPTNAAEQLKNLAAKESASEFDGQASMFRFASVPRFDGRYTFELLHAKSTCTSSGNRVVRVRCEVPKNEGVRMTTYWLAQNGKNQLFSLGKISQLMTAAFAAARTKETLKASEIISYMATCSCSKTIGARPSVMMRNRYCWLRRFHI
jgi:hypothetical protein